MVQKKCEKSSLLTKWCLCFTQNELRIIYVVQNVILMVKFFLMFVLDQTVHGYLDVILSDVSVALRGRGRALLQASCINDIERQGQSTAAGILYQWHWRGRGRALLYASCISGIERQGQSTVVCILYQWHWEAGAEHCCMHHVSVALRGRGRALLYASCISDIERQGQSTAAVINCSGLVPEFRQGTQLQPILSPLTYSYSSVFHPLF